MALNSYLDHASDEMASSGSVSSMFSPAAYLAELYTEAKQLHPSTSANHLDKRRPDLASLVLSQDNMDNQQSVLSLFNNLLVAQISASGAVSGTGTGTDTDTEIKFKTNPVQNMLATYRQSGVTPFHYPYAAVRACLLQKDPQMTLLADNPVLTEKLSAQSMLSLYENISPDLYALLTEAIPAEDDTDKIAALIEKNFGSQDITKLKNVSNLAKYYDLDSTDIEFLQGLFLSSGYDTKGSIYTNGHYTTFTYDGSEPRVTTYASSPDSHMDFIELIPQGGDNYLLNFKFKSDQEKSFVNLRVGLSNAGDEITKEEGVSLTADKIFSYLITLTDDKFIDDTLTIHVCPAGVSWGYKNYVSTFQRETSSFSVYLLKLNKIIRLYKALSLDGRDTLELIKNNADFLTVDASVLRQAGLACHYQQHYGLMMPQARVLAGGNIGQVRINGNDSEFARLFSLTDSEGNALSDDGTSLDLAPDATTTDTFRIAALCRALGVDSASLQTLWSLTGEGAFTCTIENLSSLYRMALLARVNGLSATALQRLLDVAGLSSQPGSLEGDELEALVRTLQQLTTWLTDTGLSADALYLMLSENYSTTLTPDAENLLTTLQNNVADTSLTGDDLLATLAPLVAAEMQLGSSALATAILQWFNQHPPASLVPGKDGGTALDTFWQKVLKGDDEPALVAGFQRLGQFTLLVQGLGLSDTELSLFVSAPQKLRTGLTTLTPEAETIHQLSRFHRWLQQCGKTATEVLTSLAKGTLTPESLAGMTGQNLAAMTQAAKAAMAVPAKETDTGTDTETDSAEAPSFSCWHYIDATNQMLTAAASLGVTPGDLQKLLALDYVNAPATVSFTDWMAASQALMSALDDNQTDAVSVALDEGYAEALSAWYINHLAPAAVTTRDALYDWLLLDSRTAGDVMTTPVAAAIASVQLYVNRVLNGVEQGMDYAAQSHTFFTRWNQFNKSYSTWAGGKKLAYYPENYVDPTVRIGQTAMMSDMLQTLSQSELSEDTVASAFNTYMADFENIANLSVISAYHDGEDLRQGLTWFIGQSPTDSHDFYWRTLDQALLTDGKYPANAWSEWVKIDTAISPYNGLIKPVVYNSRLYLVWLEQHTESTTGENNTVTRTSVYKIKWSWKLHNGAWATPQEKIEDEVAITENTRLYCGYDNRYDFICYSLFRADLPLTDDKKMSHVYVIASDNAVSKYSYASSSADEPTYEEKLLTLVHDQLDSSSSDIINVARYVTQQPANTVSTEIEKGYANTKLAYMSDGAVSNVIVTDENHKTIDFDIQATVTIDTDVSNSQGNQNYKVLKKVAGKGLLVDHKLQIFGLEWASKTRFASCYLAKSGGRRFLVNNWGKYDMHIIFSSINVQELIDNPDKYADKKLSDLLAVKTIDDNAFIILDEERMEVNYLYCDYGYPNMHAYNEIVTAYRANADKKISEIGHDTLKFLSVSLRASYLNLDVAETDKNSTTMDLNIPLDKNVHVKFTLGDVSRELTTDKIERLSDLTNNTETFSITGLNVIISDDEYKAAGTNPKAVIDISADFADLGEAGFQRFSLEFKDPYKQYPVTLHHEKSGVQYLEAPPYRTRLNTLFAHSLVSRAVSGLDAVLSMDTQKMQEPIMGVGCYITLTLNAYDPAIHGDSPAFSLVRKNALKDRADLFTVYSGELSRDNYTTVTLFMPNLIDAPVMNNESYNHFDIEAVYAGGKTDTIAFTAPDGLPWALDTDWDSGTFTGLKSASVLSADTEAMDFSGSSALYFWEMFYYVPMMVFQRLLDEQRYDDARTWLNYVWNPGGYIYKGRNAAWTWNVRPLEEDTSWNTDMPDTFDPDAVAQSDPMHYKAATVMKLLDMLIARGDGLFRQVTTDALAEAKMWYEQAQHILGSRDLTLSSSVSWADGKLADVAAAETSPFLPEQNEQIDYYLQTLAQRLYNLRHNLSIDGQPLSLSVYSTPADPKALQSAAVAAASGGSDLPNVDFIPQYRFPVMLQDARNMTTQLSQFGSTMLNLAERQDAEAMAELLQTQGSELALQAIAVQQKTVDEIDADVLALKAMQTGTQARLDSYQTLYDENISSNEQRVMDLNADAARIAFGADTALTAGAAMDMAPNIFGLADGGSRWGAVATAFGMVAQLDAELKRMESDKIAQSENYRRRREDWGIQRDIALHELAQITAQLNSLSVRREGAVLQKAYLETQQKHTQAQMSFLQSKFSNQALYSWMKGKLSGIYYTFYDLTISRCLMAEKAYGYDTGEDDSLFIRAGAWQGTYAGLLAGETLMLSLAQMEAAYLKQDTRSLEVTKTVSLAQYYSGMGDGSFTFREEAGKIVSAGSGSAGADAELNGLSVKDDALNVAVKLSDLGIKDDYPTSLGSLRRIKQVSVTLPALLGPYEDVRAVLSYGGSTIMPKGCRAVAISHGMHDSGQFQLNFEDSRYLPFEGIPVDDSGALVLSFPDMAKGQKDLLSSLNDVILHIAYTIR